MSGQNFEEIDEEDFEKFALNLEDVVDVIDLDDNVPPPDSDGLFNFRDGDFFYIPRCLIIFHLVVITKTEIW